MRTRRSKARSSKVLVLIAGGVAAGIGLAFTASSLVREFRQWIRPRYPGLPKEWISSELDAKRIRGVAALVDFERSELILETCEPPRSLDPVTREPRPSGPQRGGGCNPVIWGTIAALTRDRIAVQPTRAGSPAELEYRIEQDQSSRPVLQLVWSNAIIRLVPGTANDLMDRLQRLPEFLAERQEYLLKVRETSGVPHRR